MGETSQRCLDETVRPEPRTAYGRSKLAAEELVLDYGKRTGSHVVCLRLPLVYGPGNKGNLYRMISAIDRGMFPPMPDVGNRRSIVHIGNVVQAALLAANHPAANGQCYIVADARAYSTRELYELICNALGKRIPRWYIPIGVLKVLARVGDAIGRIRNVRFVIDSNSLEKLTCSEWYRCDKIVRDLGYAPSVTFEDTVQELIGWYRSSQL